MRKAGNLAEIIFWKEVRNGNFHCIDFDRQTVIGNYIVDFYVKRLGLVIELIDTKVKNNLNEDFAKNDYFTSLGLKVYSITEAEVKYNLFSELVKLEDFIIKHYARNI